MRDKSKHGILVPPEAAVRLPPDSPLNGIRQAPDATLLIHHDGTIADLNHYAELLFGYRQEELVGRNLNVLIPERFRGVHAHHSAGYIHEPRPRSMGSDMELRALRKDGSEFPIDIALSPRQTPEGVQVLCSIRDLSARIEHAIEAQLRFERLVTDISTRFARLPAENVDDEILRSLQQIVEFLDVDRSGFGEFATIQGTLTMTHSYAAPGFPVFPRVILDHQFPWYSARLRRGEVVRMERLPDDLPVEAMAEREYSQTAGFKANLTIPLKVGGSVAYLIAVGSFRSHRKWPDALVGRLQLLGEIFANALARKHAEETLRTSEKRYRTLFEASPIALLEEDFSGAKEYLSRLRDSGVINLEDYLRSHPEAAIQCASLIKVCAVNQAALVLYEAATPDVLLGSLDRILVRESYPVFTRALAAIAEGKADWEGESVRRAPDGQLKALLIHWSAFPGFDETLSRVIVSITDISRPRQMEESLRSLGGRLIRAQEEERARIARELHDDLSQRLALVTIGLEELGLQADGSALTRQLQALSGQTKEIAAEVHHLSHQLHPSQLEMLGLVAAVRSFCSELSEQRRIEIDFKHEEVPRALPPEVTLCLYRIVQEGLQNACKHSGANRARIELTGSPDSIHLRVADDGAGFNPDSPSVSAGLGLVSMRERVRLVNGELGIQSKPGHGTRIEVRVPTNLPAV